MTREEKQKCEAIQGLLFRWMHSLAYMMSKNIIYRDVRKYMAMEKIKLRMDYIKNCSPAVHYRWLCELSKEVREIMPPAAGKFKGVREKLIRLLDEADKHTNSQVLRVLIQ